MIDLALAFVDVHDVLDCVNATQICIAFFENSIELVQIRLKRFDFFEDMATSFGRFPGGSSPDRESRAATSNSPGWNDIRRLRFIQRQYCSLFAYKCPSSQYLSRRDLL
jgi:hypothetical protein